MPAQLSWSKSSTPSELVPLLTELAREYPVVPNARNGLSLTFEKVKQPGVCEVQLNRGTALIRYSAPAQAGRGIGALLSRVVQRGTPHREATPFTMLGIMLDCSRNAVMRPGQVKRWMRQLILLGYNMVMLYTEDTYELPGEPYFGFQRGAYTAAELKDIDTYAAKLGIEVIPCIQTLGHLERILRHGAYWPVRDTGSVVLVGEQKTYDLIEKMVKFWRQICRTRRIHIGMDETHDLGRGRYMDLHGYKNGFELFNEHLNRVSGICRKHGLKPMIWSDMYFRLGSKNQDYYDTNAVIPKTAVKKIPAEVQLVYWDYYHNNKEFYLDWIARHRKMGKEPLMGSGIWTWDRYWHDYRTTESTAGPCIEACRELGVKELFFTMWGDNGAYCDHDSAFAGMAWCAEKCYATGETNELALERRFEVVCKGNYKAHIAAGNIHGCAPGFHPCLWDDPIFETHFRMSNGDNTGRMMKVADAYTKLALDLEQYVHQHKPGNMEYAWAVAEALASRYTLSAKLLAAYRKKDRRALRALQNEIIAVVESVWTLDEVFREMWLSHNKPEGMQEIQGRFGMLEARYRELARRLAEYLNGEVACIPELEWKIKP